ncbi:glycoside hydrolase family 5 protein [Wenzhouxiangella sp. XN24]|uniref:glycoside hydrolase family 5 protein n=1 Tax=Wenzhouxiangella sp. XN24 TaxID=2713569 RepID=UPI0013EAEE54|nr:glycoside hydrolase family 5 protein [Wenzhouxiangella sp. XN24]NGX16866.1 glycoside hydrolase family 5 protein [Wenzhouxiangella sp. XN24]
MNNRPRRARNVAFKILIILAALGIAITWLWSARESPPVPALGDRLFEPRDVGATTVAIDGTRWMINGSVTYPGGPAEGLLMNARMVNAVFEDDRPQSEWPPALPENFNPDANTDAFIARMPEYVAYGMRAFTLNLQGGSPKYEGAHNSAFNSDGSLRDTYMARVERVIEAAGREGAVIILGLFYQRQHHQAPTSNPRALNGKEAIRAAVVNTMNWIKARGYGNVMIEIANEFDHGGFQKWHDGEWLGSVEGQVELIQLAQTTHHGLLVSTSPGGHGTVPAEIAEASDFILLHTNHTDVPDYPERIRAASIYDKPVVINEDDKLGKLGAEAAQTAVDSGASWGLMLWDQNQAAPFEFAGAIDDPAIYNRVLALTGVAPFSTGHQADRLDDKIRAGENSIRH